MQSITPEFNGRASGHVHFYGKFKALTMEGRVSVSYTHLDVYKRQWSEIPITTPPLAVPSSLVTAIAVTSVAK